MLPMKTVRLQLGELLAADATTLAPAADNNVVALVAAEFNVNEDLVIGDLTLATFTGSAPKLVALGAQAVGIDPATQQQIISLVGPVGGFRFEASALTNLPETIWGFVLLNEAMTIVLGADLLPAPVTIQQVSDFVDLGTIKMTMVAEPLS